MPRYAHSKPGEDELLGHHLAMAGRLAEEFGTAFGAGAWARALGLLHDLGKACDDFQKRLGGDDEIQVDHAIAGAAQALDTLKPWGAFLAYAVAGHHGGLPDPGRLAARLERRPAHDVDAVPVLPSLGKPPVDMRGFGASLFIRMLFSCLVDADFLATEAFYRPDRPERRGIAFDAAALLGRLLEALDEMREKADPTEVNNLRARVLARCLKVGREREGGLFSLTVPTGGGKTLASMAFALAHAERWGKRRVICVAPYTSIIEQTARVYRDALGAERVLEHHGNFRHPADGQGADAGDRLTLRLAEENWDAPVVVTTAVQFLESLFAARPSRCRKLHNIVGSVVLLDEAQLLPLGLLAPCLAVLRALARDYGCTIVLVTSTQPALADKDWLGEHALPDVVEIMEDPGELHAALRRVRYDWAGELDDGAVAARLAAAPRALAVVNTRAHARALFDLCRDLDGIRHLSALMSPAHRARVVEAIGADLKAGRPCRVVATQVVECGVDLDFPVVLRALAGLDSIVQAAGRCNRSGGPELGNVTVFQPAGRATPPQWRNHAALARRALEGAFAADPGNPEALRAYFQSLYNDHREGLDRGGVLTLLTPKSVVAGVPDISFDAAARAFRLIEEEGIEVVVAAPSERDEVAALLARAEAGETGRDLLRALQRHAVRLRPAEAKSLAAHIRSAGERVLVLDHTAYDAACGVLLG
jgi:CRISPR-associated endonuclease/helicase Cas3